MEFYRGETVSEAGKNHIKHPENPPRVVPSSLLPLSKPLHPSGTIVKFTDDMSLDSSRMVMSVHKDVGQNLILRQLARFA